MPHADDPAEDNGHTFEHRAALRCAALHAGLPSAEEAPPLLVEVHDVIF
jgi:hypothetical protein